MNWIKRHLIPASPWYAKGAAGCGLAAIGLYVLRLVSQLATRAYSSMLLAVMAAGKPIDTAVLDQNGLSGEAVSTVTYVAGPTIPLVMGVALLAVAHMVSLSALLRGECTAQAIPMRRKIRAFAAVFGILSVTVISIGEIPILLAILNPCRLGFILSIPSLWAETSVCKRKPPQTFKVRSGFSMSGGRKGAASNNRYKTLLPR